MVTGPTFVGTGQWSLPHLAPEYTQLDSGLQAATTAAATPAQESRPSDNFYCTIKPISGCRIGINILYGTMIPC